MINSVNFLVKRVFDNFDANRDKSIDIKSEHKTLVRESDEDSTTFTEYSFEKNLKKADTNQDGKVTRMEMDTYIRSYDTNQNGRLDYAISDTFRSKNPKSEFGKFLHYGGPEITDSY